MTSLEGRLTALAAGGRKLLSVYVTAGDPAIGSTPELVLGLARAGADMVELGVPFTDPLADGPVIQEAHTRAIGAGVTFAGVLAMAGAIRKQSDVPVIFMGYVNTLLSYGLSTAMRDAAAAGVDGMIVPDLPLEESGALREAAAAHGLSVVLLVAPTTPDPRVGAIARASTGFVYCVSALGVTGMRAGASAEAPALVERVRAAAPGKPVLVGFGISSPADAKATAAFADGVIVGSAVVSRLADREHPDRVASALAFVSSLRSALG